MLVLAVDTATPAVTAGVVAVGETRLDVLATRVTVDAKAHGELLTPHLLTALDQAGHTLAEVDALVCGVGPGPFTGLRAGMATAAALGHALRKPVYPVCTLDAIAAEVDGPVLVATDARRKEVYWARYDKHGVRVAGPNVDKPGDIDYQGPVAGTYDLGLPRVAPEYPSPAGLVRVARAALLAGAPPDALIPLYLRRPDAVEPGARKRVTTP